MSDLLFVILLFGFFGLALYTIVKGVQALTCPPEKFKTYFKMNFVKGFVNHNEINKIQKGECIFKIENNKFFIKQGENEISDNMPDIYNMRYWTFKESLYFAIKMRSHSEYMFNLPNADMIVNALINLAKKFKIEIENCGESEE